MSVRREIPPATVALASAHIGSDFAQGAIPAIGAILVLRQGYSLAEVGGLIFAVNAGSAVLQPLLGALADRTHRAWNATAGVLIAALGLSALGLSTTYSVMITAAAICGSGIALFHPEAGRLVHLTSPAELSSRAMSVFALGGNIGFALGPIISTPVVLAAGQLGILLLGIVPLLAAVPLVWVTFRTAAAGGPIAAPVESNIAYVRNIAHPPQWSAFARLGAVITLRSAAFYALQALVPAYFVTVLHTSAAVGNTGLTVMLVLGAGATLIGGWRARSEPQMRLISWPLVLVAAAIALLMLANSPIVAMVAVASVGAATFAGFSPSVVLGQRYLPTRTALASGVAFGLAPGLGSALAILVGHLADTAGPHAALAILLTSPVIALPLALTLPAPRTATSAPQAQAAVS